MSQHQLENQHEAKAWLAKAAKQKEQRLKAIGQSPQIQPPSWHERIIWQLLRREAENLSAGKKP